MFSLQSFIDFRESPIKEDQKHLLDLEESPPPLPPRTYSLQLTPSVGGVVNNKPLPTIPNSESFNEDITASEYKNQDAINNFINNEKNSTDSSINRDSSIPSSMTNRPLPPIPMQNSLDKVHESDSDENEFYDDDSDINENESHSKEKLIDISINPADDTNTSNNVNDSTSNRKSLLNNGVDMALNKNLRYSIQINISSIYNVLFSKQL